MKRRAETTLDPPQRILSECLAQASAKAAVNTPRMENVRRTIRRHRAENGDPANPRDRANISAGDPERISIFATDQCLSLLEQSDNWFPDGKFSVSPVCFYQVYTIHAMALDKGCISICHKIFGKGFNGTGVLTI